MRAFEVFDKIGGGKAKLLMVDSHVRDCLSRSRFF